MKHLPVLLLLLGLLLGRTSSLHAAEPQKTPPPLAATESKAQTELKALVARQKELLAQADQAADAARVEALRPRFQKLVNDYEQYLADYPAVAAGYASYALLLGKPVLGERRRAAALLVKANELDPDQPLVKNQLGNWLAEENRPLEAVNYYLAAIRLEPQEPLYHYQLGTLLAAARDDFLKGGEWTRSTLDQAMQEAFRQAAALAPERMEFTYRYGESFYDVEKPDWNAALEHWRALEARVKPGAERQTVRLHEANILLKQGKIPEARALLATVDDTALQKQKEKLTAQLPDEAAATPGK